MLQLDPSIAGAGSGELVAIKLIRRPIPRVVAPNILREIRVWVVQKPQATCLLPRFSNFVNAERFEVHKAQVFLSQL